MPCEQVAARPPMAMAHRKAISTPQQRFRPPGALHLGAHRTVAASTGRKARLAACAPSSTSTKPRPLRVERESLDADVPLRLPTSFQFNSQSTLSSVDQSWSSLDMAEDSQMSLDLEEDELGPEPDSDMEDDTLILQLPAWAQALLNRLPARTRGLVLLNLLVVVVATNWVVVKEAGNNFDPFYFASLRFAVAAAALSPFLLRVARHPRIIRAGVELGALTAAGYLTQSAGLMTTDASRASFLSTFTVLVVPLLAGLTGRGVRPAIWGCAAVAVLGVSLLEQSGAPPCSGDVWSAISAVAFGVQIFRTEHWSRIVSPRATIPLMSIVLATTAAISAVTAAAAHPAALVEALGQPAEFFTALSSDSVPWNEVLYTGLLSTDLALLMELVALRDVASSEAAIIYTLEPVLGALCAFVVLGERWGPSGWAGAALIIGSSVYCQLQGAGRDDGLPGDNKTQ